MSRAMTYDEIAAALGIARDSARRLVRRKGWSRKPGNDGTTRILVPLDELPARTKPEDRSGDSPADSPGESPGDSPGPDQDIVRAMVQVIDGLREELSALRPKAAEREAFAAEVNALRLLLEAQRTHGKDLQQRIEELQSALDAERRRAAEQAEELRAERDRWAAQAERLALPAPAPAAAPEPRPRSRWWWRRAG